MREKISETITEFLVLTPFLLWLVMLLYVTKNLPYTESYGEWGNLLMVCFVVRCMWLRVPDVFGKLTAGLFAFTVGYVVSLVVGFDTLQEPSVLLIMAIGLVAAFIKVRFGFTYRGPKR